MFFGDYDSNRAASWTHELERTFETMECAEEDQFGPLRFALKVQADDNSQGWMEPATEALVEVLEAQQADSELADILQMPDVELDEDSEVVVTCRAVATRLLSCRPDPSCLWARDVRMVLGVRRRWPFRREGPNRLALLHEGVRPMLVVVRQGCCYIIAMARGIVTRLHSALASRQVVLVPRPHPRASIEGVLQTMGVLESQTLEWRGKQWGDFSTVAGCTSGGGDGVVVIVPVASSGTPFQLYFTLEVCP
ncbi:hypothetical protein Taro_004088 [Colocasia esculenta]|uniref:Uncharacterized protein n=1 Tax=Colocasia esculenta TaxID=4460 RepID=A0A843TTS1_COLES|nr:hypothetical protein [Colocasia esculenta]